MPSPNGDETKRPFSASSHHMTAGVPLDYSFKELKQINDILYEEPVSGITRYPPLPREQAAGEYLDALVSGEPAEEDENGGTAAALVAAAPRPHPDSKYNSNALRLCNNQLATLQGLHRTALHVFDDPTELVWLDVSCNQLTSVEDVILKFPKLQVLYLHGNLLASPQDVLKLAELKFLTKLTLHGNPLGEKPNHKMWVAAHLPNLKSINFSSITKVERDKINTWHRSMQKQQVERMGK